MSVNANIGIPDERAREISKEYSKRMKPFYVTGNLTESISLELVENMPITVKERIWLAYHVGGVNRLILYAKENARQVIINW